jgi:hypothetical protein
VFSYVTITIVTVFLFKNIFIFLKNLFLILAYQNNLKK